MRGGAAGEPGGAARPAGGGTRDQRVTRVMVADGDRITHGQPLVAIEAMKMEHVIRAPRDGRVKLVRARTGDMVAPGTALVELEADGGGSGEGAKSERS